MIEDVKLPGIFRTTSTNILAALFFSFKYSAEIKIQ